MNLWRWVKGWFRPQPLVGETRFAVGQVWTINDPPTPDTRVIIGAIDRESFGRVISIAITHGQQSGVSTVPLQDVFHAPVEETALDRSVVALVGESEPPEAFHEAYDEWRRMLKDGEAGFFTVTAAEILGLYFVVDRRRPDDTGTC
jgi:hypothetical protein